MIHGGTARNILAKECTFDWEFRGLPNVAYDTAIDRMNAQIERIVAAKAPDPTKRAHVETHAHHPVPGLNPAPGSAAESLALKLGRRNATITVSYASEAGPISAGGNSDRHLRAGLDRPGASAGRIYRDRAARGGHRVHAPACHGIELSQRCFFALSHPLRQKCHMDLVMADVAVGAARLETVRGEQPLHVRDGEGRESDARAARTATRNRPAQRGEEKAATIGIFDQAPRIRSADRHAAG